MLGPDIHEFQMADRLIDAHEEFFVPFERPNLAPLLLFEPQNILRILCEGLAVVQLKAHFDIPLKISSRPLQRFFGLAWCHAFFWCPCFGVDHLFSSGIIPGGNCYLIGNAILAHALFNACHGCQPPIFTSFFKS